MTAEWERTFTQGLPSEDSSFGRKPRKASFGFQADLLPLRRYGDQEREDGRHTRKAGLGGVSPAGIIQGVRGRVRAEHMCSCAEKLRPGAGVNRAKPP